MYDGHNYYPTNKWVLFGHHFAAISGAGPLIGPVLAAQFSFLPGLLWLVIGVCIGGAVHDFMILAGSVTTKITCGDGPHRDQSFVGSRRRYRHPLHCCDCTRGSWFSCCQRSGRISLGTFTVAFTIPLALLMGLYMYRFRKGKIVEASIIGVIGLLVAVYLGGRIADSPLGSAFTLSRNTLIVAMAAYGFIASIAQSGCFCVRAITFHRI
jgi:carbon starvation protein